MSEALKIDISSCLDTAVGTAHGLTDEEISGLASRVRSAHRVMKEDRRRTIGFYDLYKDKAALARTQAEAARFADRGLENFVVLGIGGSALGFRSLHGALNPPFYNLLSSRERAGRPRVFVMDNIDPVTIDRMMRICPPEKTLYNVISKSGTTGETVAQALIIVEALESKLGAKALKKHIVVTTSRKSTAKSPSPLQQLKEKYGLRGLVVPENVGGRFSVFSPVGLFPAAVCGIDIRALAAGCAAMDRRCATASLENNPAYLLAVVHHLMCTRKNKPMTVMMPYADALRDISEWFSQLWGESLGKKRALKDGTAALPSPTPIRALGTTDQHSQLQLYLEGPNDKLVTVLDVAKHGARVNLPRVNPVAGGTGYLAGSSINSLLAAECQATIDALHEAKRPVVRITLPSIREETVGQLLYMFEVQTAMAGQLHNVNAFDQPAVERIKVLTRKYMRGRR